MKAHPKLKVCRSYKILKEKLTTVFTKRCRDQIKGYWLMIKHSIKHQQPDSKGKNTNIICYEEASKEGQA